MSDSIQYPYMNFYCEKCQSHYLLDGDESRCRSIPFGRYGVMCAQVRECNEYEENEEER